MSGRQELDALCRTTEQRLSQLVLEALDLTAQRRLGDVQAPRGAPDVALLGDRDEVFQLIEAHAPVYHGRWPAASYPKGIGSARTERASMEA